MTRNVYSATTSASNASTLKFRLLMDIDSYTSGPFRACTGGNFIIVGATTYTPVGALGGIEPIKEESDVFPRALRCWIAAINTADIQNVIGETAYNKPARLYRAFLDENYALVNTPELVFKGRLNTIQMKLGDPERGNYYEVEVESRLAQKAKAAYLNKETHWTIFGQSGDTFFEHIPKIPLFKSLWGHKETTFFGIPSGDYRDPPKKVVPYFGRV